jgi:outer membrane protein OmpA-like peptidoglycan-associated protein
MKKMSWGLYGLGMALLLTSCVAKKKYVEAQNRISQLEQQNADCTAKTESLNTNLTSLQQKNSDLQHRYDSSINSYTAQQTKWNDYSTYYNTQSSSAQQLHQTLHQQLDDMIGASNIVLNSNKVYITLPESTLFTSGSTSLSSKGKQIVTTLASTISQNPDVEVYVATSATDVTNTAMNYNNSSNNSTSMNNNSSSMNNNNSSTYNNNTSTTNNGNTYNSNNTDTYNSGNGTTSNYNSTSTKKRSYSSTPKSSRSYASTTHKTPRSTSKYKSEASHRSMRSNYAHTSTKPSSNSMAVARASTIVSTLRQGGVQKAGIQVTDPVNGTSSSPRKYQVIVSPTMQGYYDMMGKETGMK